MDASDIIRKMQTIAVFNGYKQQQTVQQPKANVSTCVGFNNFSTIHKFGDFETYQATKDGLNNCANCGCS